MDTNCAKTAPRTERQLYAEVSEGFFSTCIAALLYLGQLILTDSHTNAMKIRYVIGHNCRILRLG